MEITLRHIFLRPQRPISCRYTLVTCWQISWTLGKAAGYCSFCLPCRSFLGHWENWMLGWAWDVLNEGSPHHHSHVRVDVCASMCECSGAKHLRPKPKRHIRNSRLSCLKLNAHMPTHTHTAYQPLVQQKALFLCLPSLSISELRAATLLKHWGWQGSVSLQSSSPSSTRAEAELQVSTSGTAC